MLKSVLDAKDYKILELVTEDGKVAVSRFIIKERFSFASLAEVKLESGRTHQIRVHLAHTGHPVFGDPAYGGRRKALKGIAPERRRTAASALGMIDRQALHAWRLRFLHPSSGEELVFETEPPQDMVGLLTFLREETRRGT